MKNINIQKEVETYLQKLTQHYFVTPNNDLVTFLKVKRKNGAEQMFQFRFDPIAKKIIKVRCIHYGYYESRNRKNCIKHYFFPPIQTGYNEKERLISVRYNRSETFINFYEAMCIFCRELLIDDEKLYSSWYYYGIKESKFMEKVNDMLNSKK
jgi:hypothetical protein